MSEDAFTIILIMIQRYRFLQTKIKDANPIIREAAQLCLNEIDTIISDCQENGLLDKDKFKTTLQEFKT